MADVRVQICLKIVANTESRRGNALTKQRIFIIDDESALLKAVVKSLENDGFIALMDLSPIRALQRIKADPPDLVVLDICMDEMNGLDVCRDLKNDPRTNDLPIIMASVKSEEADIVLGLEMGADDYIRKPLLGRELASRIKAVLRRKSPLLASQEIKAGPLRIDHRAYKAFIDGKELSLTPKQFEVLAFLVRNEGRVLTRGTISSNVWGVDLSGTSRAVDNAVDQVRRKLGPYRVWIKGLKGVGYRFETEA